MLYWVHIWTHSWSVHDPNVMLAQNSTVLHATCGVVLHKHDVPSEDLSRPWQHVIPQNLNAAMPVHRFIQDDQVAAPAMIDCPLNHDWWATISMSWLNTGSCHAPSTLEPYHHYGIVRTWTHQLRCSVFSEKGLRFGASEPTHDDIVYATKSVLDIWQDVRTDIQQPQIGL